MTRNQALLQGIFAAPDDDGPRLIYADWLEENGWPGWACLIRVQCELARLPGRDPRRPALEAREAELLRDHGEAWCAQLPAPPGFAWEPLHRGFPHLLRHDPHAEKAIPPADYYARALDFARHHPHTILPQARAVIATRLGHRHELTAALSYLPERDWPALAEAALQALVADLKNTAAMDVLEEAAQQCPEALHPHLDTIFTRGLMPGGVYGTWPWHGSGTRHFPFLKRILENGGGTAEQRQRAWVALLATRHPEALACALANAETVRGLPGPWVSPLPQWMQAWLAEVGLALEEDGELRSLDPVAGWHLGFPAGYFHPVEPAWLQRDHPTWRAPAASDRLFPFGGEGDGVCEFCGGTLHHLLTLDPVPAGLGVTGLRRLSLQTCLSCLGREQAQLDYRHDSGGSPRSACARGPRATPEDPVGPLAATAVCLNEIPRRWRLQRWGAHHQNLNRVGGPPAWVQAAAYAKCPDCRRTMSFLVQFDSGLPRAEAGAEWSWAGGGMAYAFWCAPCRVSAWRSQAG
ncbi:MAG: TIGR02996 domain-containing protein [Gemmataceae bacterium]|nr:TIGR02996 domain-containing protein [Gemmataceae bacterium]